MSEVLYDGTSGDPTVISYDPGGTSGWAVFSVHPDALRLPDVRVFHNFTHKAWGEFTGDEFAQVDEMLELALAWPGAALVTEAFVMYDRSMGRKDENLWSLVRLNTALRYGLYREERAVRPMQKQTAALAKSTVTDDRLRMWGFWEETAGMPHARDAIRHNLTLLKRLKSQPKLLRAVFPAL